MGGKKPVGWLRPKIREGIGIKYTRRSLGEPLCMRRCLLGACRSAFAL